MKISLAQRIADATFGEQGTAMEAEYVAAGGDPAPFPVKIMVRTTDEPGDSGIFGSNVVSPEVIGLLRASEMEANGLIRPAQDDLIDVPELYARYRIADAPLRADPSRIYWRFSLRRQGPSES